jgi:hypothetical protein
VRCGESDIQNPTIILAGFNVYADSIEWFGQGTAVFTISYYLMVTLLDDGIRSGTSFEASGTALCSIHWLPPHSADKTQPLDLGLFGLIKTSDLEKSDLDPRQKNGSIEPTDPALLCATAHRS